MMVAIASSSKERPGKKDGDWLKDWESSSSGGDSPPKQSKKAPKLPSTANLINEPVLDDSDQQQAIPSTPKPAAAVNTSFELKLPSPAFVSPLNCNESVTGVYVEKMLGLQLPEDQQKPPKRGKKSTHAQRKKTMEGGSDHGPARPSRKNRDFNAKSPKGSLSERRLNVDKSPEPPPSQQRPASERKFTTQAPPPPPPPPGGVKPSPRDATTRKRSSSRDRVRARSTPRSGMAAVKEEEDDEKEGQSPGSGVGRGRVRGRLSSISRDAVRSPRSRRKPKGENPEENPPSRDAAKSPRSRRRIKTESNAATAGEITPKQGEGIKTSSAHDEHPLTPRIRSRSVSRERRRSGSRERRGSSRERIRASSRERHRPRSSDDIGPSSSNEQSEDKDKPAERRSRRAMPRRDRTSRGAAHEKVGGSDEAKQTEKEHEPKKEHEHRHRPRSRSAERRRSSTRTDSGHNGHSRRRSRSGERRGRDRTSQTSQSSSRHSNTSDASRKHGARRGRRSETSEPGEGEAAQFDPLALKSPESPDEKGEGENDGEASGEEEDPAAKSMGSAVKSISRSLLERSSSISNIASKAIVRVRAGKTEKKSLLTSFEDEREEDSADSSEFDKKKPTPLSPVRESEDNSSKKIRSPMSRKSHPKIDNTKRFAEIEVGASPIKAPNSKMRAGRPGLLKAASISNIASKAFKKFSTKSKLQGIPDVDSNSSLQADSAPDSTANPTDSTNFDAFNPTFADFKEAADPFRPAPAEESEELKPESPSEANPFGDDEKGGSHGTLLLEDSNPKLGSDSSSEESDDLIKEEKPTSSNSLKKSRSERDKHLNSSKSSAGSDKEGSFADLGNDASHNDKTEKQDGEMSGTSLTSDNNGSDNSLKLDSATAVSHASSKATARSRRTSATHSSSRSKQKSSVQRSASSRRRDKSRERRSSRPSWDTLKDKMNTPTTAAVESEDDEIMSCEEGLEIPSRSNSSSKGSPKGGTDTKRRASTRRARKGLKTETSRNHNEDTS